MKKLRENEDALSSKQKERAQLDSAFRDLMAKGFTPTPSPVRTPAESDNEGEEGDGGEDEGVPDVSMEQRFWWIWSDWKCCSTQCGYR